MSFHPVAIGAVNGESFLPNPHSADALLPVRLVSKEMKGIVDEAIPVNWTSLKEGYQKPDLLQWLAEEYVAESKKSVTSIAEDILENFPSDTWAYVGIGRSPTPVLARLMHLKPASRLINIPLGGVASGVPDDVHFYTARVEKVITPFLTDERLGGKKKCLLLDYAAGGKALFCAYQWISTLFRNQNREIDLKIFAIADHNSKPELLTKRLPGETTFSQDTDANKRFVSSLFGGDLKKAGIDLYDSLKLENLPGATPSEPNHIAFNRALRLLK